MKNNLGNTFKKCDKTILSKNEGNKNRFFNFSKFLGPCYDLFTLNRNHILNEIC